MRRAAGARPNDEHGNATYFQAVNRNKRSVAVDLSSEAGRTQARELAASADVVVENFRPDVMDKLGLGYETLVGHQPAAGVLLDHRLRRGRRRAAARAMTCSCRPSAA